MVASQAFVKTFGTLRPRKTLIGLRICSELHQKPDKGMERMIRKILSTVAVLCSLAVPTGAQDAGPVVIELFTSQGCSSCPPADALLLDHASRDDVITLALHVDYWDYIGWADTFARPEYTARQRAYARASDRRMIYTPQMILNGETSVVGSDPAELERALQTHQARAARVNMDIERDGDVLHISAQNISYDPSEGELLVQLLRYSAEERVEIRRGENAGKTMPYSSVVRDLTAVTRWDASSELSVEAEISGDLPIVVLIQKENHGSVLAAARLR